LFCAIQLIVSIRGCHETTDEPPSHQKVKENEAPLEDFPHEASFQFLQLNTAFWAFEC
jgi:hypothetical protein